MWVVGIYFNDTDDVIMTVSNILKVSAVFVGIEANGLIAKLFLFLIAVIIIIL